MKELINSYFSWFSKVGIIVVLVSAFFLFTNLTTEFYDTPKLIVLLVVSGILLVLITLSFTVNNKVIFVRTPLDIPLLLLLVVSVISTFASSAPYVSLLGNQLRVHTSLISTVGFVLFYFVILNSLKSKKEVNFLVFLTTIFGGILSLISLLAYAGVTLLPPPWSHGINFTTTGSNFSTTAILALLIPIVASKILHTKNFLLLAVNCLLLTLFGITIALTGTMATYIAGFLGIMFVLVTNRVYDRVKQTSPISLIALITPIVLTILVAILSFIPPMGGAKNPIHSQAKNFAPTKEVQLGLIPSWKVSVSAFRDNPFWGLGPSSYLFNYTNYKPVEVNSSNIWNLRFESAFNEYFQVLGNLGGVGLIALISLTALFATSAWSYLNPRFLEASPDDQKRALAISGLIFFVILALHASSLVFWIVGLFLIACFYLSTISERITSSWNNLRNIATNFASPNPFEENIKIEALPSILLTIALGAVLFAFYFGGKFVVADYHHRLALNAASQNQIIESYNQLVTAEKLNPYVDMYHADLAQVNFALANAIAASKAPTEASPSGSLTDQDQQNIQVLLQQSINEGKIATQLSPRSALNWEILGLLYRQIAGVAQNALTFSLDAYGRAIFQDPLNPNLRLSVGGVYYAVQNYDMAIRFFTDAINLKTDLPNAYYNLSVALRDKGDLNTAQVAAERVLTLVEKDSQDYKLAEAYLTDLKNRIASGSAQQSDIKPTTSQTNSALEKENLPKVVDVGQTPEKIATPGAVKRPNSTPEPTANP